MPATLKRIKSRKSNISKKLTTPSWVTRLKKHEMKILALVSFKPNPLDQKEFDQCMSEMSRRTGKAFQCNEELVEYLERRWNEFSYDAVKILSANLQPGDVKWGYKLHIGTLHHAILDRILCLNHSCKKETISIEQTINREKVPTRIFKYHFFKECGFPKLKSDYDWTYNLLFPTEEKNWLNLCEYTSMTLVCNDYDNRVYVNWEMSSHIMRVYDNNTWGKFIISV